MRLKTFLVTGAVVVGALGPAACGGSAPTTTEVVTSGECPREQALVRRALERSSLRVDVNGDGRLDRVATASAPGASEPCRGFVGVRVQGGSTYSTHLFPRAVPVKGLPARVNGLPDLGDEPGAEIVVDTRAAVDSALAQMFTLAGGRLQVVEVPGSEDGTFIVEGGGVVYPQAAACTAEGRMVLSGAAQNRKGTRFKVTRRTYEVQGDRLRFGDPVIERARVPVDDLLTRFPEFGRSHWQACTGTVRR